MTYGLVSAFFFFYTNNFFPLLNSLNCLALGCRAQWSSQMTFLVCISIIDQLGVVFMSVPSIVALVMGA